MTSAQAALGPLPDVQQAQRIRHFQTFASPDLSPVYDPDQDGGCPTGGPPYMDIPGFSWLTKRKSSQGFNLDSPAPHQI
jgi:hypothetical protein